MANILRQLRLWLMLRPRLFGEAKIEELPEPQRRLAEEFRRGIAKAVGVPEEAINEETVVKWVTGWSRAFIKPEYLEKMKQAS